MVNKFIALFIIIALFLIMPTVEANNGKERSINEESSGLVGQLKGFVRESLNNLTKIDDLGRKTWENVTGLVSEFSESGLTSSAKKALTGAADAFEWLAKFIRSVAVPLTDTLEEEL